MTLYYAGLNSAHGLVAAADRARNRGAAGSGRRLGGQTKGKTGHIAADRVPRLQSSESQTARPSEPMRTLPRIDRVRLDARPERDGKLSGSGRCAWLQGQLSSRQTIRPQARRRSPRNTGGDRDADWRRSPGRLRFRPSSGARSSQREIPPHAFVRVDARLQPEVDSPAHDSIECARLGRAARDRLSPVRRCAEDSGAGQSRRRRVKARLLRSGDQSGVSRLAGSLRRDGFAVPCARSGSQGQSRIRRRPRQTDAEAQAYLDRWEQRWADTRIHGTTKQQVATLFETEKPALQPLPLEPFRYYEHASGACIWTAVWRSKRLTTACRRAGSGTRSTCNSTAASCASSIR